MGTYTESKVALGNFGQDNKGKEVEVKKDESHYLAT